MILDTVRQAQVQTGEAVEGILARLKLPKATYYRWLEREQKDSLEDSVVIAPRRVPPPTPQEREAVCHCALAYPLLGYKRLTWLMVDEDVAYLRSWQVHRILKAQDLLCRTARPAPTALKRPPEPDHPDQVWHVDLMYLSIPPRWYYLVDILDGYSRFLVHWSLNRTMLADTVTDTVQQALDRLPHRRPGEPKIIHDRGSQFLSREWRTFVEATGLIDIKTRVAHPQSNGRLERLHRTHREEGLAEELSDYYQALQAMTEWQQYYNHKRPHSALKYLRPIDYYRGDPNARLAERNRKLDQAFEARRMYWQAYANVKELQNLSLK